MTDNGVPDLEQATPETKNAPQPTAEQKAADPRAVAPAAEAPTAPTSEGAGDSLVRSVYIARTEAREAALAVDFSIMETSEAGRLVRGAYLARLTESQGETAGDHEHGGEDVLRRAYVARLVVELRPPSGRVARVKKKAAPAKQPARSSRRKTRAKAKAPKARAARRKR
jgi:hypothetical protein